MQETISLGMMLIGWLLLSILLVSVARLSDKPNLREEYPLVLTVLVLLVAMLILSGTILWVNA